MKISSRGLCGALLLILLSLSAPITVAQADSILHGPVTALAISGDRLLIGQGTQFIDAKIGPDQLAITTLEDLKAGVIRSIAVRPDGSALVLSEAALTLIDNADTVIDSVPFGGQQVILNGDQVYVAALDAGIRRFQVVKDKLTPLTGITISAPAESIAFQGTDRLWIAEGAGGLWEYQIKEPTPTIIFGEKSFAPATLVRVSDPHLIVGYGNRVAVLATDGTKVPHPTVNYALGDTAQAGESLLTADGSLLIGRVDAGGADLIMYSLNPATSPGPKALAQFGTGGAGEQIVRDGSDFFYGSARTGLQRITFSNNALTLVASWPMDATAPCALADYTPSLPEPANRGIARPTSDGSITLNWHTGCAADRYVVRINGQVAAEVDQPPYHFMPSHGTGIVTWQVSAQVGTQTINGAPWLLETAVSGLLTIPTDPNLSATLYQTPNPLGRGLLTQTPLGKFLMVCALGAGGLLVIAIGAWLISTISTRSHTPRL